MRKFIVRIFDVERLDSVENAQHLSVGQVDFQWVRTRHVLKLTDHGRHIVTENIELQKVLVDFVVIEMGCDNIRVHIVCRMLNRTKLKDLMVVRTDYDAARMLTRRPLYARTVLRKSVFLVFIYRNVSLFKIFRDIAVSGLFRYRAYGSRLENVFITENNADVFMRLRLVFACEIKVDIGLFVPF